MTTAAETQSITERQVHILVMENPGYPILTHGEDFRVAYEALVESGHIIRKGDGYWPNYG